MAVTQGDIEAILAAIRPRLARFIQGSGPSSVGKIPPHEHSAETIVVDPAGETWTGYIEAENVQAALEELDDEKLARSGVQPMRGSLDMDDGAGPYDIFDVKNLTLSGAVGQGVIAGARVVHLAGDDSDSEALLDGVERITFNNETTKSLIEVLSRTKWNIAVVPGTSYTPAEGDLSWNGANGIKRLVMQLAGDSRVVEASLGGVYIRVGNFGTTIPAGTPVHMTTKFATWNVLLANPTTPTTGPVYRGITMQSIGQNLQGWVCVHGYLGGIDLSALSAAVLVYLSTTGGLTSTIPAVGAGYKVRMGHIISGTNPGAMWVDPQVDPVLGQLSDVSTSGKSFHDVVMWADKTPNNYWEPKPASWFPTRSETANHSVAAKDVHINMDATGGNRTVTLPLVADSLGRKLHVKKIDTSRNQVILAPGGADTIEGATTFPLVLEGEAVTIICDATEWRILS